MFSIDDSGFKKHILIITIVLLELLSIMIQEIEPHYAWQSEEVAYQRKGITNEVLTRTLPISGSTTKQLLLHGGKPLNIERKNHAIYSSHNQYL